ncbi:MAG: nitronate monooxygenase [Burkholderiales bacterium]|nr:nitronate monooxygenase [Burkholderiales bacterium]
MARPILKTALCERLGIEYPILLAGMGSSGFATPPALVAAVSEAGGMGVLGGAGIPAEKLRQDIRAVRKLTRKPIGVDLLLPARLAEDAPPTRSAVREELKRKFPRHVAFVAELKRKYGLPDVVVENELVVAAHAEGGNKTPHEEQVDVIMAEDVQVFAAGLGDPSWVVPKARRRGMQVIGLVGNVRHAQRQVAAGVDIVVAQGYEGGGHTGKIANFPLLPQVVDAVSPVPVVAAGGIGDGRGVAAALSLGAVGAWIGTAFLVADECAIPEISKERIVNGRSEDFDICRVFSGKTMRGYRSEIVRAWEEADIEPLPMPYQKILMDDFCESAAAAGRWDLRSNPAGQIAGMLKRRQPAKEIFEQLVASTVATLERLKTTVTSG